MSRQLRVLFLLSFSLLLFNMTLLGQDLIQRTIAGTKSQPRSQAANRLAKIVQQQKTAKTFEKVDLFEVSKKTLARDFTNYVDGAIFLTIDEKKLAQFKANKPTALSMSIPVVARRNIELELTEAQVSTNEFILSTSDGQSFSSEMIDATFYRGIIKGDPQSLVAVTITENRIAIMLSDDYSNYEVAQMEDNPNEYILYNSSRLKNQTPFNCGVDLLDNLGEYSGANGNATPETTADPVNRCVPIYMEVAFQMYEDFGSDLTNVFTHVLEMFNATATIFQNEDITIGISEIYVHTTVDQYYGNDNAFQVHELFARTKANNFNGRLGVLFSTQDYQGVGGIAWLNQLCGLLSESPNGDYVSGAPFTLCGVFDEMINPFPTYSGDVGILAHELGHLFGSPHTHGCYWNGNNTPIDDCGNAALVLYNDFDDDGNGQVDDLAELYLTEGGDCLDPNNLILPANGTIMSYCHIQPGSGINFSLGFGPQPGNLIRNNLYNSSNCLLECTCPFHLTVEDAAVNTNRSAENSIITENTVNVSGTVTFGAYESITLQPGFSTTPGATFTATLDGCMGGDNSAYETGYGSCTDPIPITCGQTISESLINGLNVFYEYNCGPFYNAGNELVFMFDLEEASEVTATLSNIMPPPQFVNRDSFVKVFILTACDNNSCVAGEVAPPDNFVTATLDPGTYYIIVDEPTGVINPFDLTLTCNALDEGGSKIGALQNAPLANRVALELMPNPITTSTMINFNVLESSPVNLSIRDITGKQIQSIKQQEWMDQGQHRIEWQNLGLSSGIYFLHLEVNGQSITQKMVLTP